MKKYICLLIFLPLFSITVYAQIKKKPSPDSFTIIVDVSAIKPLPRSIILTYFPFGGEVGKNLYSDSVLIKAGKATFKGNIAEPELALLATKYFGAQGIFYLIPRVLHIKADTSIDKLTVSGSPYQKDLERLLSMRKAYENKVKILSDQCIAAYEQKDTVKAASIQKKIIQLNMNLPAEVYKPIIIAYAKTSPVSVAALSWYDQYQLQNTDSLYTLLAPKFKKLPTAVRIKKELDEGDNLKIGKTAPDFTQPDTSGKLISLSAYRGKYVLVDFWASWCQPCREESPNLVQAYSKYHDKSFEILSISLDEKKSENAWHKAISDDKVNAWKQLSDLSGWKNAVVRLYHISSIPQNFLIDPKGRIIAYNLRGDELEKKLNELLKTK